MLAHNKQAGYVKEQEHGHARFTQPQPQPLPLPQPLQQRWLREHTSWGQPSEHAQRHRPQHQDNHSKRLSDYDVSLSSMHSSPVCIRQTGSSAKEMASITIHPTIANMVSSPASLCSAPPSPPQLSPDRALAPAPSPLQPSSSSSSCPRNASESPEMESNLQQHDLLHPSHYQNKHTLVTERRSLLPSPLPAPPTPPTPPSHPPPRYRDEIMMDMTLDQPTVAELSSSPSPDSRMDHCEPAPPQQVLRGWSWSSSSSSSSTTQASSSPSPPIDHSCMRPHPQAVLYHLKEGEQQPHANQQQRYNHEHQQCSDQRAHNYQQYSQAPPWPEHPLQKQPLQHHPSHHHANHTTSRELTITAGPSVRQRPPTVYPSKKSRANPMSFPEGHSMNATSTPGLPQRKSCPVISTSSRTPTLVRTSSQRDQEEGDSSSPPRPDRDQRRRSIALPLPKNFEWMSAAQKMLYERHPPSPKTERYPAPSSTPSPSTTASSHPSSPSSLSSASDGSFYPLTSPGRRSASMTSKDGTERMADHVQERHSEKLPPLLHAYEYTSEHNRLPVIGHHPPQKEQRQHPHQQQHQPQHSARPGNLLQDPPPTLPSLSSFAFPRARHPHSAPPTELTNRRKSSSRGLTSLFSSSSAMTLSSLSLAPAPTNNGLNNNNNTYNASSGHFQGREGSKTGATGRDLKRSNSMTTSNSSTGPRTDGLSLIRNEDGTIMVYNPLTESMTFRCELCPGESFGRIHDLKRHQTSKHQEMTWPCDFCHRPFVRRDALLRHYTVKAARDDGLHPASHEVERLLAARARAKMLY